MQLVAEFHEEQQARVEIMTLFNQWLQNGEQAAGYKELQSLRALPCIEKLRDPESPAVPLELVRFNLQNKFTRFTRSRHMQPNCLRRV